MNHLIRSFALASFLLAGALDAQVPQLLNYQGRVAVGTVNFDGSGQFKFALVNTDGTTTYWSNDATSTAGGEPTAAVALTVIRGLYSVALGDTTLANMTAIPPSVFANADVRLRVWFDDGANGSQLLTPDQRITSVGYAMMAETAVQANTVADGAVTSTMIADNAVLRSKIANNAVTTATIVNGAVTSAKLAADLTLAGTTTGNFSGDLAGNATTAGSAVDFTGSLLGDVTGTQGETVVTRVGGVSAANVATGANLANAATHLSTPNTIVKRDANGNFTDYSFSSGSISFISGGGAQSPIIFAGPTFTLTLVAGQKVLLNGSAIFGRNTGDNSFIDFDIGVQSGGSVYFASGAFFQSAKVLGSSRSCFSTTRIFTASTAGTYTFGFAVRNTSSNALDSNDFATVTALVF